MLRHNVATINYNKTKNLQPDIIFNISGHQLQLIRKYLPLLFRILTLWITIDYYRLLSLSIMRNAEIKEVEGYTVKTCLYVP